jgi:ParB-like chromosome segregation protein Spo0J
MKVEMLNPALLEPSSYNPRKISAEEMASLRKSLREFGLVQPIVVQMPGNRIIAGHQRRDAVIAQCSSRSCR